MIVVAEMIDAISMITRIKVVKNEPSVEQIHLYRIRIRKNTNVPIIFSGFIKCSLHNVKVIMCHA